MTDAELRKLVEVTRGPLGTIYACPYCRFFVRARRSIRGGLTSAERRAGHVLPTQYYDTVVIHMKSNHPDRLSSDERP